MSGSLHSKPSLIDKLCLPLSECGNERSPDGRGGTEGGSIQIYWLTSLHRHGTNRWRRLLIWAQDSVSGSVRSSSETYPWQKSPPLIDLHVKHKMNYQRGAFPSLIQSDCGAASLSSTDNIISGEKKSELSLPLSAVDRRNIRPPPLSANHFCSGAN